MLTATTSLKFSWQKCSISLMLILLTFNPSWAIINGDEAKADQFKFMVAIETEIEGQERICGGSLIAKNIILTSAKCLSTAAHVKLTFGGVEDYKAVTGDKKVTITKENFLLRDEYKRTENNHDIGLIILKEDVKGGEIVKLPELEDSFNTYMEKSGTVIGYGKFDENETVKNTKLRFTNMTIIPLLDCELSYMFSLKLDQMCTSGVSGKNICLGDMGSPFIVDGVQVGIVSYGSTFGCSVGFPAVFTRITSYIGWLKASSDF